MKRQRNRRARGQSRSAPAFADHDLYCDSSKHNKADHKTAQLCRQVLRTLTMALADCADDQIRELTVLDVAPAPDATRLMVTVLKGSEIGTGTVSDPLIPADSARFYAAEEEGKRSPSLFSVPELLARLLAATPHLRREIAAAITRKRVPELMFQIVCEPEGQL